MTKGILGTSEGPTLLCQRNYQHLCATCMLLWSFYRKGPSFHKHISPNMVWWRQKVGDSTVQFSSSQLLTSWLWMTFNWPEMKTLWTSPTCMACAIAIQWGSPNAAMSWGAMKIRQALWETSTVALHQTEFKCLEINSLISEINPLLWKIVRLAYTSRTLYYIPFSVGEWDILMIQ